MFSPYAIMSVDGEVAIGDARVSGDVRLSYLGKDRKTIDIEMHDGARVTVPRVPSSALRPSPSRGGSA
jgi:hypothetical protein